MRPPSATPTRSRAFRCSTRRTAHRRPLAGTDGAARAPPAAANASSTPRRTLDAVRVQALRLRPILEAIFAAPIAGNDRMPNMIEPKWRQVADLAGDQRHGRSGKT